MTAPRRVRIARLVLDGVQPADRAAVLAGFHAELTRMLTEYPDGPPPRGTGTRLPPGSAADIGRRAATAVHARVVAAC